MLKHYFKIASRNIYRHFSYSLINILGLAIGFASAMVIGLWVHQEWSYDRHFENADQLYRVGVNFMNVGDMAVSPPQLNDYVRDFPEVEQVARLGQVGNLDVHVGDAIFTQPNIYSADSTFFDIFSYKFIKGNPKTALDQPRSAVLTREAAEKFFGTQPAIGAPILLGEEEEPYMVTGVVETDQKKSHINASMWVTYEYSDNTNWLSANTYSYTKLYEWASRKGLETRLGEFIENTIYPTLSVDKPYDEWSQTSGAYHFNVMPVTDIYLKSDLKFETTPGGSENNVMAFFAIALLIIITAAVNFINITTARSSIRAKEVGIRKTFGTGHAALALQFLMEAVLVSFIALIIGLGLSELFLWLFEAITGTALLDGVLAQSFTQILIVTGLALLVGLMAGIYPAVHLAAFKPVDVLKGRFYSKPGDQGTYRNGLVFLQFTISICLLIGAAGIYQQLQYMKTKDLGLNRENVFVIQNVDQLGDQKEAFRQELLRFSGAERASYTERIPASSSVWVSSMKTRDMINDLPMQSFIGDYEMIPTLGFRILQGRNFSKDVPADTNAVLLNESGVKALALQDPVGAELSGRYKVIGIVADFNFESLRKNIEPTVIEYKPRGRRLAVKLSGQQQSEFIDHARTTWQNFDVKEPIDYYFLDSSYAGLMEKEQVLAQAVAIFTILAIIISCLGLYGLSTFVAEQRRKEIGVRRVLGATTSQILILLNKSFTKPILVSLALAIPLAFILLQSWLRNFAFKTAINPWIFIGAGGIALLIAWVTMSWQSLRAALANPVDSLRSE